MWPMLTGQFLAGDDQVIAGYAFRDFGAEHFKTHGSIPEWNPYLFGGMPFIAAMHGDIFYPTAWLRWLVPTGMGMNLGFFIHLVIAGGAMFALLRGLKLSWTAAVAGGLAYELSGILASMLNNGHDGKLFVSALAPLAFLALLRAIRHGRIGNYGIFALVIGLAMLSPHYQMTYYLLVASGLFTLWLVFLDTEREKPRAAVKELGSSLVAVSLGIGIGMIQGLPFLKYLPYSPRVDGGASSGWEYATSYALPVEELMSTVLPQFNGIAEFYWGSNFFKTHVEYLGVATLVLAIIGIGYARKRGLLLGFGVIALLFLLVAFGGHTPFYRLWYGVMPMMDKVRAAGMAFFLVALPVCVWAACGVERIVRGEATTKVLHYPLGAFAIVGLLGATGMLQPVAEALAPPERRDVVLANASALQMGALRMLLMLTLTGGVLIAIQRRRLAGGLAAASLLVAIGVDQWSVLTKFNSWLPPAEQTYAPDQIISSMKQSPAPFRNYDPRSDAIPDLSIGAYGGSWLMADRVPTVLGYHGNEVRFYDELWGTKNIYANQLSPSLWDLWAVRYITTAGDVGAIPGYHRVMGPVSFPGTVGRRSLAGFLYERDSLPEWVRVVPAAIRIAEERVIPTVIDPNFPADLVALVADTATVAGATDVMTLPPPTAVAAQLTTWDAGAMTVKLTGRDDRITYLLIAESWAAGWQATVDGLTVPTHRANHAMLSVALPPGAGEVSLIFVTPGYATGKLITLVCLLGALGIVAFGFQQNRKTMHA
jgi:hypothetical protein